MQINCNAVYCWNCGASPLRTTCVSDISSKFDIFYCSDNQLLLGNSGNSHVSLSSLPCLFLLFYNFHLILIFFLFLSPKSFGRLVEVMATMSLIFSKGLTETRLCSLGAIHTYVISGIHTSY